MSDNEKTRNFISLANVDNYDEVAVMLHISQPPVTRSILLKAGFSLEFSDCWRAQPKSAHSLPNGVSST